MGKDEQTYSTVLPSPRHSSALPNSRHGARQTSRTSAHSRVHTQTQLLTGRTVAFRCTNLRPERWRTRITAVSIKASGSDSSGSNTGEAGVHTGRTGYKPLTSRVFFFGKAPTFFKHALFCNGLGSTRSNKA